MSSFLLSAWLNQNEDQIVRCWQTAISDQGLSLLRSGAGCGQQAQRQELRCLYRDIVNVTSSRREDDSQGLVEWARRCRQESGLSLVDLLRVVFALRKVVSEVLSEPAHAEYAVEGWRTLVPHFERIVEILADSCGQSPEPPRDSSWVEEVAVATTGEKEHIEALYAIGREINVSLDLDHVLEKTLDLVTRAVGARHGSIMLLDHDTGDLVYRARLGGRGPLPAEGEITPFKPGVGVAGWVLEHREPALIGNVLEDDRWLAIRGKSPLTRALIAAPLLVGDDLHGVILISDGTPHRFGEFHLRLVIAAAHQVAQAIRNAQLYDHVRGSAEQLARLLRREQEETSKHQAVLQSIADGVVVSDTQDRVIVFNATAEAILETEADTVVGQDVWQLFDAFEEPGRDDALTAFSEVRTLPAQTLGKVIETRLETKSKVISARLTPVVTEGAESLGVVIALRDITREVEADRAKSEFVSTVSHELRTPLTSIKGYADLLRAEAVGSITEHQRQFLDIVKNNADRLTALINDLLDISYIETGRVRLQLNSVSLAEVVECVVASLRPQIEEKGLRLEVDIPAHVDDITGDRARLIQVVTNLLDNACKYTDRGWIRVSLSSIEPSVDESIGRAVRLDVIDSGIGMSMEDQGRIFERFYRADATIREGRGGTGLGLAISRELIELHRGRIWVTSELGTGSTFTVILPSAVQELSAPLLAEVPAGARKILVVDDERDILALLQYQLGIQGYRVVTASTGEQAILKAIEERPDLITLDILLPDRNGFDVLRELKSRSETSHIPVIVLSVIQSEDSGYRLGVADYLVKPLDEGRLLSSISRLLGLRGKVLIAEDHPDTAEMLITLLRECGYEPLYAADGYETLAIARREQPGLILLDLRMPGMDGYEALTRLKKDPETRRIPILVMSAHAADVVQERLRLKGMGAADFLAKPFSLESLLEEIERVTVGGGG